MSEVFLEDSNETLKQITLRAEHIVVVPVKSKDHQLFKEVIFPKKTHHSKSKDSRYREYVEIFTVKKVLKSSSIKDGEIQVWAESPYGEGAARLEHEKNQTESPIQILYRAKNPVGNGSDKIIFLQEMKTHKKTYIWLGEEDASSESDVVDILKTSQNEKAKK